MGAGCVLGSSPGACGHAASLQKEEPLDRRGFWEIRLPRIQCLGECCRQVDLCLNAQSIVCFFKEKKKEGRRGMEVGKKKKKGKETQKF